MHLDPRCVTGATAHLLSSTTTPLFHVPHPRRQRPRRPQPRRTMKYIEYPELARLAQALSVEGPECSVHTRLEAYSCKNIKRDKKLFRTLESAYNDERDLITSHSPPSIDGSNIMETGGEMTPFGPIDKHASRKTLYLLIATLNIAFPDYEFSDVKPQHFNKEQSGAAVLNALSTTLITPHRAGARAPRTYSSYPPTSNNEFFPAASPTSSSPLHSMIPSPYAAPKVVAGTHPTLYRLIDEVIGLAESEVFSYVPDIESDPHASDLSDDEDDGEAGDEDDSSSDSDQAFEFDNYDIDEHSPNTRHGSPLTSSIPPRRTWSYASSVLDSPSSPMDARTSPFRSKRRGALLWSSHWFFLNRKLKRILFISVWAKTRGLERSWDSDLTDGVFGIDDISYGSAPEKLSNERFIGWEGGVGAGARAMGLRASI